jgi:DUF438 domain-containing protein
MEKEKVEIFKDILKRLHKGEDIESLKKQFGELLSRLSPFEIPVIEQELLREGEIDVKDIIKMCDLHVEFFRGAVSEAGREIENLPEGHPLRTLYEENKQILKDAEALGLLASSTFSLQNEDPRRRNFYEKLVQHVSELSRIGYTHYTREEMLIFPYIERRGITAVPTVLWSKHDEVRLKIKLLVNLLKKEEDDERLKKEALELSRMLSDMVFRENNILYPTLKVLLSEGEWKAIKMFEKDIGYYKVEVVEEWETSAEPLLPHQIDPTVPPETYEKLPEEIKRVVGALKPDTEYSLVRENDLKLESGYLSMEELNAIFKTLPIDVTFVDKHDRVRFFSGGHRIFHRAPTVLGRPVQFCHPPRSVHIVNKILKAFKEGRKDPAEFWINMGERKIHIRYFPVLDEDGNYMGTLEVVQDITDIKKLEGEKRLLDWE